MLHMHRIQGKEETHLPNARMAHTDMANKLVPLQKAEDAYHCSLSQTQQTQQTGSDVHEMQLTGQLGIHHNAVFETSRSQKLIVR